MNKNGIEDAYYLGLRMPLGCVTTDSRIGCLKTRVAVRNSLNMDVNLYELTLRLKKIDINMS